MIWIVFQAHHEQYCGFRYEPLKFFSAKSQAKEFVEQELHRSKFLRPAGKFAHKLVGPSEIGTNDNEGDFLILSFREGEEINPLKF